MPALDVPVDEPFDTPLGGDAVLRLDAAGRVTFANLAAAHLLGAESALAVVGDDTTHALRRSGQGSAALALHSAVDAVRARASTRAAFTVHDALGTPVAHWQVTPHGTGVSIVVRPAAPDDPPADPPVPNESRDDPRDDSFDEVAGELAGASDDLDRALERLAAVARTRLGGDGACVLMLGDAGAEPRDARIVAANGTLATLGGQATELHEPPSPLHHAITTRRVVVSALPGADRHSGARRYLLVAPFVVGGARAGGALCVVTAREPGPRERALAERLAEHGALAMRNRRQTLADERGARDARLLAGAARILARHVTPQTLYPALARVVREALGACGFTVTLADVDTGHVDWLYSEGTGDDVAEAVRASVGGFWECAGGGVVRDGAPLFVDGTLPAPASDVDRAVDERLRGTPAHALALLPLVADETRGLLALQFPERRAFDEAGRRLLADFAAHVAVAVRNTTLLVTRERERDRAAAAADIARVALDAASTEAGAAAILGVLDRLVPSQGKALSLLRDQTGQVECTAASGTIAFLRGLRSPRAPRTAPRAVDTRVRPVLVDDLRRILTPERCPPAAVQPGTAASAVVVPLVARGRALGDLVVTTPLGEPLPADGRDALVQLAAPVALAMDALLLNEERRRRVVEERQMMEQLRQAEKMAALGELVAGVAHEINNPLTGISAFAELLLDDVLTDEQRESVRLIKREADRAVGVVRDLLAFSRKTEPAYTPLDLNDLIERTLRLRAYALRAAGVEVELALDPARPVVLGDEAKLQQVLLNVLLNAEHAMRDAAERRLTVATRRERGRVVVSVADTGAGIAPDVLPRIFEPFFTTKPAGEGTGLGLSVSYGIVQAHGGELHAESAPGGGARLDVVLPAHHVPAP